jgi:predicted heme/steroid binding protein/uncharacterized membrane protein
LEKRLFSESELKNFDGKEGRPAYVAIEGKVFDVSESRLWVEGRHMELHSAGEELNNSIKNAPHDTETLSRFPVVGELIREDAAPKTLAQRVAGLYPHPIIVHFPIAFSTTVPLLSLLYLLTGEPSFELASFYILTLGLLVSPLCGLSGAFSWKINYGGIRSRDFSLKIRFALVLVVLTSACFVWRLVEPNVLVEKTGMSYLYLAFQIGLALVAAVLGHTGGKIVFAK